MAWCSDIRYPSHEAALQYRIIAGTKRSALCGSLYRPHRTMETACHRGLPRRRCGRCACLTPGDAIASDPSPSAGSGIQFQAVMPSGSWQAGSSSADSGSPFRSGSLPYLQSTTPAQNGTAILSDSRRIPASIRFIQDGHHQCRLLPRHSLIIWDRCADRHSPCLFSRLAPSETPVCEKFTIQDVRIFIVFTVYGCRPMARISSFSSSSTTAFVFLDAGLAFSSSLMVFKNIRGRIWLKQGVSFSPLN